MESILGKCKPYIWSYFIRFLKILSRRMDACSRLLDLRLKRTQ